MRLLQPDVVMEVAVGVVRDATARWRRQARPRDVRTHVDVARGPLYGE
ncbi:hypothetical protein [Streptomyces lavenduligriseus]|uniref:Uncharacterized protein n=1 Tax=Streptomyces lavenduligriseus TaxID=67315 RepID=A0ABT0NV40_9ACTN|nr:hypothetical protein [Streptomyces lavenduligriseus]MCL3994618.1 hypothetical protein [Streptomyces lavenduligriseus]